ncbi:MAG: hypothetical protein LYZ69_03410 [Nitrososphaerales archaeon]|nr:hypothetical protein [Nitrososphaerales archaeon]
MHNETLTNVFWGVFLIWFGVLLATLGGNPIAAVNAPLFALGTGLLLLALNFVRSALRLKLSVLTIGLGALLTVIYAPVVFFGIGVPFLPALLIIVGVALIIGAFKSRNIL